MSYRELKIWHMARTLTVDIHRMTMTALPKHEMYEEGSQIRRAIKSVRSNIVQGYGRRTYKDDFIRFIVMAHASCDEAKDHLEILHETGSLSDELLFRELSTQIEGLSKTLSGFLTAIDRQHHSVREAASTYPPDS